MERTKEKKSSFGAGLFCALAGLAVGVIGKIIYDDIKEDSSDKDKKKQTESSNNPIENDPNRQVTADWSEYESFLCPISQEIMNDPVITPKGISFERKSIINWLKKNKTCPITKTPLLECDLISNYALKNAIDDYFKKQNELNKQSNLDLYN